MVEDVIAIQQLLHRYCFVVDSGTPDEIASLFHETATLVPVYSDHKSFTLPNVHLHMMHVSFPSSQFKLRNVIYLKYKVSKTSWISR